MADKVGRMGNCQSNTSPNQCNAGGSVSFRQQSSAKCRFVPISMCHSLDIREGRASEPDVNDNCVAGSHLDRGVGIQSCRYKEHRMPSLLAITDNGSRRGCAVRASSASCRVYSKIPPLVVTTAGLLERVEHLRRRIHLVVVPAMGKVVISCR